MNYASDASPIVVDLETAGLPNAADFLEPVQPDGRLVDKAKIAADIEAKTRAREEKLALDWNVGRIVALGWWIEKDGTTAGVCRDDQDESLAMAEFWGLANHRTIVGFNIKGFDLRFLVQRSRYLGVPHPQLDFSKYNRKGISDLYLDLTFGDGHYDNGCMKRSLKMFAKRFGIPVNGQIDGKDIPALVAAGEWDKVADHCKADVELTVALARKLGVVQPAREEVAF